MNSNMKYTLFFGLLFVATTLFSQDKKIYYLNENLSPITQNFFWKGQNGGDYFHLKYELDTAILYIKVAQKHQGEIFIDSLNLLKEDLEISADLKIDPKQLIVINFYPGIDPCNSSGTTNRGWIKNKHEKYLKELHSMAQVSQFYIAGKMEGLERYKGIITWIPDLNGRVKNYFFPLDYPCGSFVIIRPDGQFISSFGEYSFDYVLECVKQLIER